MTTIDTRAYDDGGRLISSSYNNGVGETRSYNSDNTLASINYSGAAIGDLSYGWDASKNKTSESIGGVMSGYGFSAGYDAEDRLTSWDRSDTNLDQSWNLSPVGDWNSVTENASVQNRTHGPAHEILTAASQSVQHDVKGNMTLIPAVLRPGSVPLKMIWDFENKLQAADRDNNGIDDVFYRWDALGRRVGRDDGASNVVYFQDGQQTIADYGAGTAANNAIYTYVYASYADEPVLRMDSSGAKLYYHRNQQYSITAVSDGGGSVVERYAYNAYGQVTIADTSGSVISDSAIANRYTYTGREWDEGLSLYHYRARMYAAVGGRFVSRDPIGFEGSKWNLHEYVGSRPPSLLDPFGLYGPGMGNAYGRTPRPSECTTSTITETVDLGFSNAEGVFWPSLTADILRGTGLAPFTENTRPAPRCPWGTRCCQIRNSVSIEVTLYRINARYRIPERRIPNPFGEDIITPAFIARNPIDITVTKTTRKSVGICVSNICPCPATSPDSHSETRHDFRWFAPHVDFAGGATRLPINWGPPGPM